MATDSRPTIVFFAGAFAEPTCFDGIVPFFKKAGYPCVYAKVRSLNPDPSDLASISTANDASEARKNVLLPLIEEQHKDVIVFTHSYGGVVGGAAAAGLSKVARTSRNEAGGVVGLVYLVGNIVSEGESLLQAVGGAYPPFIKEGNPSPGLAVIEPAMSILYNDVDASSSLVPSLEAAMIPHALKAFETSATAPAWADKELDGRRLYIRTLDDQCNPSFLQDIWIEKSAVPWEVADLKTSHCPFISCPEEVANITLRFVEKLV
ncbi:alpha beta hydrolase family domain-containing protein [Rutstroemia sp. NJR-2017a BBW]|nr:alpha beta hydrolase family domain-containing protein [Rutstroemia sp. NJR-2017a BBW]